MTGKVKSTEKASALRAIDELLTTLRSRMYEGPMTLQVDDLIAGLEGDVGPGLAEAIRPAMTTISANYERTRARAENIQGHARGREVLLASVLTAALAHLNDFSRSGELEGARQKVTALEAEQRQTIADLETAVERADVDDVLRLRTQCEVLVPKRLAEAQTELLELEVEQAESFLAVPAGWADTVRAASGRADTNLQKAHLKLEEAQTALQTAFWRQAVSASVEASARSSVQQRKAALEAQRAEAQRGEQQRMRKLAGLPNAVTA